MMIPVDFDLSEAWATMWARWYRVQAAYWATFEAVAGFSEKQLWWLQYLLVYTPAVGTYPDSGISPSSPSSPCYQAHGVDRGLASAVLGATPRKYESRSVMRSQHWALMEDKPHIGLAMDECAKHPKATLVLVDFVLFQGQRNSMLISCHFWWSFCMLQYFHIIISCMKRPANFVHRFENNLFRRGSTSGKRCYKVVRWS